MSAVLTYRVQTTGDISKVPLVQLANGERTNAVLSPWETTTAIRASTSKEPPERASSSSSSSSRGAPGAGTAGLWAHACFTAPLPRLRQHQIQDPNGRVRGEGSVLDSSRGEEYSGYSSWGRQPADPPLRLSCATVGEGPAETHSRPAATAGEAP